MISIYTLSDTEEEVSTNYLFIISNKNIFNFGDLATTRYNVFVTIQ